MGQKAGDHFPYETIERIRGNIMTSDNSTAHLEGMVHDSPHCGHEADLLCVPSGKFKADMPSQGLESTQLSAWDQLGSENKRLRSRSIPIKTNTAVADDSDESRDDRCMCRYDLATWQMYNRIVVHRLNCPVNLSQKVAPGVTSQQASDITTLHKNSCEMGDPMPIPDSHHYLEGEVIELELCSCEMVDPTCMPVPDSSHYLEGEVFELEL
jgi:hypothetical protein